MAKTKPVEVYADKEDTLPKLLRRNYLKWGDEQDALRKKRYGIWNRYSWKDYYENAKYVSLGLISLGFKPGDKVGIIGDNDPEWWYLALGTQAARGTQYGIFVDCVPSEIEYFINSSDTTFVGAKDQEQCDKLLQLKEQVPNVKKVIYWEPKGMWIYDDPWLMDITDLQELGREYEKTHPNLFEENIDNGNTEDIACLCWTSGTTGLPKAVEMSHRLFRSWCDSFWHVIPWYEDDEYISFLSPAWAVDQWAGISGQLISGAIVHFPERPDTIRGDAREIDAQCEIAGARTWEETYRTLQVRLADADLLKRTCYRLLMPIGYKMADLYYANEQPSWFWRLLHGVGDLLLFRPLRDIVGHTRARSCFVAGAMLSPELFRYFQAMGIPLHTYYGVTEQGYVTSAHPGAMKVGSAGQPLPGREIRVSDEGEMLVKMDNNSLSGYYKKPDAYAKAVRDDWYYTGDAVYVDEESYLFFLDRVSELMKLSNGQGFAPTYIEAKLRFSQYIKDSMALGDGREFVSALIDIDLPNIGKWAEANHISYTTYVDLAQKPEVYDLVQGEIERVNKTLPEYSKVKRFINMHKEFDADEAELTRTRKLKRHVLEDKYSQLLEAIYSGKDRLEVQTPVQYRDGRTGTLVTSITVGAVS